MNSHTDISDKMVLWDFQHYKMNSSCSEMHSDKTQKTVFHFQKLSEVTDVMSAAVDLMRNINEISQWLSSDSVVCYFIAHTDY